MISIFGALRCQAFQSALTVPEVRLAGGLQSFLALHSNMKIIGG